MEPKNQSELRNKREHEGKTILVPVPEKTWMKIEESIALNQELVEPEVVMRTFHMSKKTLQNNLASGKIPRRDYTIGFNGMKFFFIKKLMGLSSREPRRA